MQAFSQVVVLAASDRGQPGDDGVLATLAPRFSVRRTGQSRTVRRAWLDTFDWRLHRAGLTLEYLTGRAARQAGPHRPGRRSGQPAGQPADLAGPGR